MLHKNRHLHPACCDQPVARWTGVGLSLIALALLAACDAQQQAPLDEINIANLGPLGSELTVPAPLRLRSISAIDPQALRAIVLVNGVETELDRNSAGQYTGKILVPTQSNIPLTIEFFEWYLGQKLPLTQTEHLVNTGNENVTLTIGRDDYIYDQFDADGDNVSNILEREFNTNPLDSAQFPDLVAVNVVVPLPSQAVSAGFQSYNIEVRVGSVLHVVSASAGQFEKNFIVVKQEPLSIDVEVVETVTGQQLTVGQQVTQLSQLQDTQTVILTSNAYDFDFDRDADGINNIDELVLGSDLLSSTGNQAAQYNLTFDIPAEISNIDSAYATVLIEGENIDLIRNGNTYTASSSIAVGRTADIEVRILGNYQGQPLTLAFFTGSAEFEVGNLYDLNGFSLDQDSDSDGVFNYLELNEGSDPFSPPVVVVPPVAQCTPITESIALSMQDDAYVINGNIFNNEALRIEYQRRVGLMRFGYAPSDAQIKSASLKMTVRFDPGDGLVSVYTVPNFEWADSNSSVVLPPYGESVASLSGDFDQNVAYNFDLNVAAITEDFTLFVVHESDSDDISFGSSNSSTPPILELVTERCE